MAKIVLGALPKPLEVQLVHGDGASLVATLTDEAGAELAWSSAPTLEFSGAARTVVASHTASIAGADATWSLGRAQVDAIWDATKGLSQSTLVRAVLPDGDNGMVEYAGAVVWSDGWTAGSRTQAVSFTRAVSSVAGRTGAVVLTSADVGLGNVDNTADASKPVSTAQAAADTAVQEFAIQRGNHTGTQAISTVTGLQTALDGLAPIRATVNAQTGTTYTIVLADENKLVTLTNAGAITLTLPQDSSVAIPVGGRIDFAVLGAGMVTFVAGSGATANGTPSLVTRAQYSAASAIKVAANTWLVVGDLA